jgi:acetyltransferase-like isoleucine patch superfamily enzyme
MRGCVCLKRGKRYAVPRRDLSLFSLAMRRSARAGGRVLSSIASNLERRRLLALGVRVGSRFRAKGRVRLELANGASVTFGEGVRLGRNVLIQVGECGIVTLGDRVEIQDGCCLLCGGELSIGEGSTFVNGTMIYCGGTIEIGRGVLVAAYSHIMDVDHEMSRTDVPIIQQGLTAPRPVTIGDGVWLGAKATVCKGVAIGEGAVIGANAVVTRDVAAWAVAAGIPARELRSRRPAESINVVREAAA